MSTNKKFRVQNGIDITGEVTVGGVTVINADGTVVSDVSDQLVPLQSSVSALETAVQNIIGTSPETLDTLQEIVAAYEGADSDLQLLIATAVATGTANVTAIAANTSSVSALDAFVGDGNTELPNLYSPSIWTSSSPITQDVTITTHPDGAQFASNSPYTGDTTWPTWIEEGQTGQSFIIRNLSGGGTVARMVLTGLEPSSTYELTTFVQQIAGSLNHGHRIDVKWESADHPYEYQVNLLYSGTGEEYHARHHTWPQPAGVTYAYVDFYFGVNMTAVAFDDFKICKEGATVTALDTTAQTLAEAINELHTEVLTLSGADTSLTDSISANTTAISNEVTRATAAEQVNTDAIVAVQSQVNNILSNTDPASLDSLSEIVDAFQAADNTLTGTVASNATSISALNEFVKGNLPEGLIPGAPELGSTVSSVSDFDFPNGAVTNTPNVTGVEITRANDEAAAIAITLEVGKTYEVSYRASSWGAKTGSNYMAIIPASVKPTGGHTFIDGYDNNLLYRVGNDGTIYPGDEANFQSFHWGADYEVVETDRIRYITPNVSDLHIVFWLGGGEFGLADYSIKEYSFGGPASLNTTATEVVPAINEVLAAVADTSGVTAAFQAADAAVTAAFQAADATLQAQIDAGSFDGSAIDQNLVPAVTDTYSLGTPDMVWKDLYIGPGSLYLNGTKILEDNSGTITMYADAGQNLSFGATGGGSIDLNAGDESIQIKSDLVLSVGETISTVGGAATRFGGSVNMQTHKIENVGAPTADLDVATKLYVDTLIAAGVVSGDRTFDANVVVEGNLTVSGTTTTVNSETITLADNIIDLNSNLTSGAPTEHAGIRVMRGDESAVQVRWNETEDHWEVYNGSAWTKIALDTDDLAEGSTNLYFTEVRARGCVSADDHSCIDYDETTGKFSLDVAETEAAITPDSAKDADKLDGQHGSYYRINVYDANGTLVN